MQKKEENIEYRKRKTLQEKERKERGKNEPMGGNEKLLDDEGY